MTPDTSKPGSPTSPTERPPLGWCWHGYNLDEGLCPMCDMVEIALLEAQEAKP